MDSAREKCPVFNKKKKKKVSCWAWGEVQLANEKKEKKRFVVVERSARENGHNTTPSSSLFFLKKPRLISSLTFVIFPLFNSQRKECGCVCVQSGLSHLSHNSLILLHTHAFFFFFFFSTLQKGKTGKHNQRNAFFLKCKHNFRVDSNFLACSVFSFSFFFLFSNIKVFRSCPPGGRERKEKKKPHRPRFRDRAGHQSSLY